MNMTGFVPVAPAGPSQTRAAALAGSAMPAMAAVTARAPSAVRAPRLAPAFAFERETLRGGGGNGVGKGSGKVVVLFRSDLRLDDHPALVHALEEASEVIPVFVFDHPRQFGKTAYGFEKTGKYRAKFLVESVADLRKSLQDKGSDLVVRVGAPEVIVTDLCKKIGCKNVYLHTMPTYEDREVESALAKSLKAMGGKLQTFWANTLYHEEDLPFKISDMPDVYTEFREAVEGKSKICDPLPAPDQLPRLPRGLAAGDIPTLAALGIDDVPTEDICTAPATGVRSVTGGETEALSRVSAYVDESKRYDADMSPHANVTAHLSADFSCRISPWLALGCISPRRIFSEMKKAALSQKALLSSSTYFELVWRDFFNNITMKYEIKRAGATAGRAGRTRKNLTSTKRMSGV